MRSTADPIEREAAPRRRWLPLVGGPLSRRDIAGVGLAMAGVAAVLWAIQLAQRLETAVDFKSYAINTDRWLAGGTLYAQDQLDGPFVMAFSFGHVYYPPPAMLLLVPFSLIGFTAYTLLSSAFFFGGLLGVVAEHRPITPIWVGFVASAAFTAPFIQAVMLGNITIAVAGALAWAYVGRAGIHGALAGMVKVTPAAIAAIDGWRGIVTGGIVATTIVIVTLPVVGLSAWRDFATAMSNARPFCESAVSVACLTGSTTLALALGASLALACLLTSSRLARLALVTGSLLSTSMEMQPFSAPWILAYPLIAAFTSRYVDQLSTKAVHRGLRS